MKELRRKAQDQRDTDWTCYATDELEAALRTAPLQTAQSIDKWSRAALQAISQTAKVEFIGMINMCISRLAWPHQFLQIWACILAKGEAATTVDERPVGPAPVPARARGRMNK